MFDPLPKAAYTHGLELIYTLQDVDISSVRPLGTSQTPQTTPKKSVVPFPVTCNREEQLEFGFEGIFSRTITPFIAQEPIQVLGLSRQAEKALLDNSKTTLADISYENLKGLGIGQGHVEEAIHKLALYLDGKTFEAVGQVDFSSWIRSLVLLADRKKAYVALETYELQDLITLLPSEGVEVRRLTVDKRIEWPKEFMRHMRSPALIQRFLSDFNRVVDVFFRKWIHGRLGLATKHELTERWERIGDDITFSRAALQLFEGIYGEEDFFSQQLYQLEPGVYAVNHHIAQNYQDIIDLAETYLLPSSPSFNLSHLVDLLTKEFSLSWRAFPQGFIEKSLSISSKFMVSKDLHGELTLCRNIYN